MTWPRINPVRWTAASVTAVALIAATAAAMAEVDPPVYGPGVKWNRRDAYSKGAKNGGVEGNPNIDDRGQGVFHYATVETPAGAYDDRHSLYDPDGRPWYQLPRQAMTWQSGHGEWRGGAAKGSRDGLSHCIRNQDPAYRQAPLFVWTNPAGDGVRVRVVGEYTLRWQSHWDIDLVLAHHDVSDDTWYDLSPTGRYPKPDVEQEMTLFADAVEVDMDAGDELVLSVRSAGLGGTRWDYATLDDDVTISLVPKLTDPPVAAVAPAAATPNPVDAVQAAVKSARTQVLAAEPPATGGVDDRTRLTVLVIVATVINIGLIVLLYRWYFGGRTPPSRSG